MLAELDDAKRHDLERGRRWIAGFGYETREDMAADWSDFGEELLTQWIASYPGTRPFAWWLEHGQERPVVGSWAADVISRERLAARFGYLHTNAWSGGEPLQEVETFYLERNGLLLPDELARLPFAEQEPEDPSLRGIWLARRIVGGQRMPQHLTEGE
jgi:hypothetical protein